MSTAPARAVRGLLRSVQRGKGITLRRQQLADALECFPLLLHASASRAFAPSRRLRRVAMLVDEERDDTSGQQPGQYVFLNSVQYVNVVPPLQGSTLLATQGVSAATSLKLRGRRQYTRGGAV